MTCSKYSSNRLNSLKILLNHFTKNTWFGKGRPKNSLIMNNRR